MDKQVPIQYYHAKGGGKEFKFGLRLDSSVRQYSSK